MSDTKPHIPPQITWDHVHIRTPDIDGTTKWFADVFEATIERIPNRISVNLGGASIFFAPVAPGDGVNPPPVTPYQGLDHIGLVVKDMDAFAAKLKAKGVVFTQEPKTLRPGLRMCFIQGPQGISIELLERDPKYT